MIALLGQNITEVSIDVIYRPLMFSLIGTSVLFVILRIFLRNTYKSALISSLCLFLFFSYGQVYNLLKEVPFNVMGLGRHRYLFPIYGLLLVLGLIIIIKKLRDYSVANQMLNLVAVLLLIFPLYQVARYLLSSSVVKTAAINWTPQIQLNGYSNQQEKPDVYYIILDGYSRDDVLRHEFGYDNSVFLDQLKNLGFVIAECSYSNYDTTRSSLTSSLNMDHIQTISSWAEKEGLEKENIWRLIKESQVRKQFEALGYKIVAFDTGYEWTRLDDADLYLSLKANPTGMQWITPFEAMLIDTTLQSIYTDWQKRNYQNQFSEDVHPKSYFINQELFILSELPKIADIQDPTFTFAHVLIPHVPFVFSPDGILTDPGYYTGKLEAPVDEKYFSDGYIQAIQYANERIIPILTSILENSSTPPIIIIQADHGLASDRFPILNAYYLPDEGAQKIFSTITPVNTFRLIFDTYFGGNYGLVPDASYSDEEGVMPVLEYQSRCQ